MGLETPIRRAGGPELESPYLVFLDDDAIISRYTIFSSPVEVAKELRDVLRREPPHDLNQAIQRDGRQIPFDLGDEPLGQSGPALQLLLGQVAQLPQVSIRSPIFMGLENTIKH